MHLIVRFLTGHFRCMCYFTAFRAHHLFEDEAGHFDLLAHMPDKYLREKICPATFALLQLDPIDYSAAHEQQTFTASVFHLQGSGRADVDARAASDTVRKSVDVIHKNQGTFTSMIKPDCGHSQFLPAYFDALAAPFADITSHAPLGSVSYTHLTLPTTERV